MSMYQPDLDRLSTGKTSGAPMPFDVEAFTIEARELVAQGDRVPAQRIDPETLAMIAELKAEHPVESCDLFRTVTGRCTCSVGGE